MRRLLLLGCVAVCAIATAAEKPGRYMAVLSDPPLAEHVSNRKELHTAAVTNRDLLLQTKQAALLSQLAAQNISAIGQARTLVNAIFFFATESQAASVRAMPGVLSVNRMLPRRLHLNAALDLMNVPNAWNSVGGVQNAGAGVKIGIIDTGIDIAHPAFQDSSLQPPPGYPKCKPQDCTYTNNKVIVARSYVDLLNFEFGTDPVTTRPDDTSPRDRVGHGTAAAMAAAGVKNTGPAATITGVAPKAFLGNYKIFGSPGLNDVYFDNAMIAALEDALADGMDIVNISSGAPALCSPSGKADLCGADVDNLAPAVDRAVLMGMTVVASAGNDGDLGSQSPANSIASPGISPSVITVGASENKHSFLQTVRIASAPGNLSAINARFTDGPKPLLPLAAPIRDVTTIGNDGLACAPLGTNSLSGAIALVKRGTCTWADKVLNAANAGALAVILYLSDDNLPVFEIQGLNTMPIPSVLISNTDGAALKQFVDSNQQNSAALDPTLREVPDSNSDIVTFSSSQGPSIGDSLIKPDLVATGTGLYLATQSYDPNGYLFSANGYTSAQGSSFAAPIVAGAAALVKQQHAAYTPAQVKSALVNSANPQVGDASNAQVVLARPVAVGAGKLDAAAALQGAITIEPASLSFGVIGSSLPSQTFTIRNTSNTSVSLRLSVQPYDQDNRAQVTLGSSTLNLNGGQTGQITAKLSGNTPSPGSYTGLIQITGGGPGSLHIPYLYLVSDNTPANILPLAGVNFLSKVGGNVSLALKVTDRYGVPVANAPVQFIPQEGGGSIKLATPTTDMLGIAEAQVTAGQPGSQNFTVRVLNNGAVAGTYSFLGTARTLPSIKTGGVVNAASLVSDQGFAPGSYITIYGSALSESVQVVKTPYLPVSLGGVSVSFDVVSDNKSYPGKVTYVSDGQVNVQVPWELQGSTSAQIKVSLGDSSSSVVSIPLHDYSPGVFAYSEAASGKLLAASLDDNSALVTSTNPVRKGTGHFVQLFVNGLGPVTNQPPSGELTQIQPYALTRVQPSVTIGGVPAPVIFSGLAPLIVGLYQVNVLVPANVPSGIQPLSLSINGIAAAIVNLPVQ